MLRQRKLEDGEIQVFYAAVMDWYSKYQSFEKILSLREKLKASRFHSDIDRVRYVLSRGLLKSIISEYLEIAISDVIIHQKDRGKPHLTEQSNKRLYFNLSHSDDQIALVFSRSTQVGIDLEKIRPMPNFVSIVRQFFSKEELQFITTQKGKATQLEAFYHCWTRRESFLKAIGIGIFDLEMWQDTSFLNYSIFYPQSKSSWAIHDLSVGDMISCALSYEILNEQIVIRETIRC